MLGAKRPLRAFTLRELLIIVSMAALLVAIFVSGLARSTQRSRRIQCTRNLSQIGLALKSWALDNGDLFPTNALVINGDVFRYFQALSNQLSTPQLLICPADNRTPATNFGSLSNTNLSYFVGLEATDTEPQMVLSGDRNITNGPLPPNRIMTITSNSVVGWTRQIHQLQGNIGLADGSVQQFSTSHLREALSGISGTNRLAMP